MEKTYPRTETKHILIHQPNVNKFSLSDCETQVLLIVCVRLPFLLVFFLIFERLIAEEWLVKHFLTLKCLHNFGTPGCLQCTHTWIISIL